MISHHPDQLEQLFKTKTGRRRFTLGMPRVSSPSVNLTMLTPEGASMLVSQGIEVKVEAGAGELIHYDDDRYARAGATIVSRAETFACDVVVYPAAPDVAEARTIPPHGVLLTLLTSPGANRESAQTLLSRNITVIALDNIRDERGNRPLADILGEVGGRAAVSLATAFLVDRVHGKGMLLGGVAGVNPCEVVILGSGMAALAAARSAIGLGAMVRLFDSDPYCLRKAISELGAAVIGSAMHPRVLGTALHSADVVIATRPARRFAIDDSVLDNMKQGVVIFDLDDHNGISGVFPTLKCVDAAHALSTALAPSPRICLTNAACAVPRTAAMALTNDLVPIIDRMFGTGSGLQNVLKTDAGLRVATVFFRGRVVNPEVGIRLGAKVLDINLLLTFS